MVTRHIFGDGSDSNKVVASHTRIRVDHFLTETDLGLTRSQIKRLIDDGHVTVRGKVLKTSSKLQPGDEVVVYHPPPVVASSRPQEIPLDILYEDPHLIVVNKAPGMVVHPSPGHPDGTLVNALLGHCSQLSGVGGQLRPGIVHRIDKDTSGVLVVSKEDGTHQILANGFKDKIHRREYVAIVAPLPPRQAGTISTLYGRHPVHRKRFSSKVKRGKTAITHYQVKQTFGDLAAMLSVRLETGRTHQIRVHCADSGFPILGDQTYARRPRNELLRGLAATLGRQALHARCLGFVHPVTGEELSFEVPMPPDMQAVLDALANIE